MGKKRIVKKTATVSEGGRSSTRLSAPKRAVSSGVFYVESSYNNTKVVVSDTKGKVLCWSSSGSLGFSGAKKGTPFAAAKVGELLGEKAQMMGMKEISVIIKGVGSGRESAVRGFISKSGVAINSIKDTTPVPFNGPRPPKPRRV
ncbi:MAG: 30S ribosomal protein S11 [Candidatus Pacebacteria bacterium]|nr:30S ribosomal protein S11 [Candidatus Paceibacterota bacterium]MCK5615749.1 30S ribosomal protein S11 [Candidatus Pacearchaeota archaeon]